MGDVTGPIPTLPGHRHPLPEGSKCDVHPDRPAIARIQGETDSFGSELGDYCAECLEERRNQPKEHWPCDWCNTVAELKPQRDYDEGTCGRVYQVCAPCVERYHRRLEQERQELGYEDDDGWDDDPEPPIDWLTEQYDEWWHLFDCAAGLDYGQLWIGCRP